MPDGFVRRLINFWPPLLFSGIKSAIAGDWRSAKVELRLRWWNRNAVHSMFGGSLFAMTDPFYPLMLQHHLGRDYAVWTKSARIDFLAPGRGVAFASFSLSDEQIEALREATASGAPAAPIFKTEIRDRAGGVIAVTESTVHVRRKKRGGAPV